MFVGTKLVATVGAKAKHKDIPSVIISTAEDTLLLHERGYGSSYGTGTRPEDYLDAFAAYIRDNRDKIAALNIICTRPRELTRESLKHLRLALDREGFTRQ